MNTKNLPEPCNVFACQTCGMKEGIGVKDFTAHLKDAHGIIDAKGKRSMLMHVDYADRFAWSYEWVFGEKDEVKAVQNTVTMRDPESAAYWMDEE